jgi:hypothetical protein
MKTPFCAPIGALFLTLPLACGPAAPASKTPGDPGGLGGSAVVAEGAAPDLSPVAAPSDLFLVGRLKNPAATMDVASSWAKLPMDWRRELTKAEPGVDQVLHWDAPVEVAAALDPSGRGDVPQPFAVVSVGLRGLQPALDMVRRGGESVRQVRAGVYRVGRGSPSCAMAASVGTAPARLVCGDREEDVDALLPYVTRGLPTENLGNADVRIEVRAEPWRKRYAAELRQAKTLATPFVLRKMSLDDARFDRPLADAVHALTDEALAVVEDIDILRLDATINKGRGTAEASFFAKFRGSNSWVVSSLAETSARASTAPDAFFRLPKDATAASYTVGADPKRAEPIRRNLAELLDGFLAHAKVPKRLRDQTVALLDESWTTQSGSVYARGEIPVAARKSEKSSDLQREQMRTGLGWHIAAVDEPLKKYKTYFDRIVKLYGDRELRKLVEKEAHIKPKEWPKVRARGGKGLPAGSVVYELTVPGEMFMDYPDGGGPAKPGKPLAAVLILMPDGDRTWFGVSADEKHLIDRLNAAKKADGASTLASREGLAQMKSNKAVSQGFLTLMTVLGSVRSGMMGFAGRSNDAHSGLRAKEIERMFNAMPHHGETPMLTSFMVTKGSAPTLSWSMTVPKAVFTDLGALGPAIGAAAMSGGPLATPKTSPPMPVPRRP